MSEVQIDAIKVKLLREKTGAGMMECKKALVETGGDLDKAVTYLREKGLASVSKRIGRITKEGIVDSYIHSNGKIGVLLEVDCETDFVARNEEFKAFAHDVCIQVAAAAPRFVSREEVPAGLVESERSIYMNQAAAEGKPEQIREKIIDGKMDKFYAENCLLEQKFVRNDEVTINDMMTALVSKIGENILIRRFSRFVVGEQE